MIEANHQLHINQQKALQHLAAVCKEADGHVVPLYMNLLSQARPFATNLMYYQDHQLIGFLSLFFFYEDACEISLMVHPSFRRQGIARQLIQEALPLVHHQKLSILIFSSPAGLNDAWLPAFGCCYQKSEHQMTRALKEPLGFTKAPLSLRPVTTEDFPTLCFIDAYCFPTELESKPERFHTLLSDPGYHIFLAEELAKPIGKAHIFLQEGHARLSDIAVLPTYQGLGFGKAIVSYCVNFCLSAGRAVIDLDVESNNENALKLYSHLGFKVNNAYDFWAISSHHKF